MKLHANEVFTVSQEFGHIHSVTKLLEICSEILGKLEDVSLVFAKNRQWYRHL
jgi:hypothetical protein